MASPPAEIRCRQIEHGDTPAIADLLTRGFPSRGRAFWVNALQQLARHNPPPGLPRYGYLLETAGAPVGVILLICAAMPVGGALSARCNLSSWYVEPAFRAYASLLVAQAMRHKEVTYTDISAAPHTWPIIEAQGFRRYSDGLFIAMPALNVFAAGKAEVFDVRRQPSVTFDAFDRAVLVEHSAYDCISLWCATSERAYPFVFRLRLVKGFVPCAQLIYCRDIADLARFAGPIGKYLLRRGRPFVILDANRPVPGLVGIFRRGSKPKYFKGPQRPRLGDLAYTEYAILGV
jgi:hypothetical protein